MSFSLFVNFNGNCKEAVEFYAKVFKSEVQGLMTYGDMPNDPNFPVRDEDKNLVLYSQIPIYGCMVMFSDSNNPIIVGNNINPTIGTTDKDEIKRIFEELKDGREVMMELQKTFWSDLYGMVTDKYGITWQLTHENGENI